MDFAFGVSEVIQKIRNTLQGKESIHVYLLFWEFSLFSVILGIFILPIFIAPIKCHTGEEMVHQVSRDISIVLKLLDKSVRWRVK